MFDLVAPNGFRVAIFGSWKTLGLADVLFLWLLLSSPLVSSDDDDLLPYLIPDTFKFQSRSKIINQTKSYVFVCA